MRQVALVLLAVAALAVALFVMVARPHVAPKASLSTLREVATQLGVVFPPSAVLLEFHSDRGIDERIQAKVSIRADELSSFIEGTPIAAEAFDAKDNFRLGVDHGNWNPKSARGLRTGSAWLESAHRALNVGIGAPEKGWVIVYLVNYST